MIFQKFITKTFEYLHSFRVIKDHVSLDLKLPSSWTLQKSHLLNIEVLQSDSQIKDGGFKIYSLVCKNEKEDINNLEKAFDNIVKYNLERQEKEKLFKVKIQELKHIFENEQLDNLKNLKIDIELHETLLEDEGEGNTENDILVSDTSN
jgi:hypothetical protein